jgi:hypothetical protein
MTDQSPFAPPTNRQEYIGWLGEAVARIDESVELLKNPGWRQPNKKKMPGLMVAEGWAGRRAPVVARELWKRACAYTKGCLPGDAKALNLLGRGPDDCLCCSEAERITELTVLRGQLNEMRDHLESPTHEREQGIPPLDRKDACLLRQMEKAYPNLLTLYDLAESDDGEAEDDTDASEHAVSRKTAGLRVNQLIQLRLACRPKGPRRGVTITLAGRRALAKCPRPDAAP